MDPIQNTTVPAGGVPPSAAPIMDQQQQQQIVQTPAPNQQYAGGGSLKNVFSGVTLVDVLAAAMFFAALGLTIAYYRNKIKFMKSDQQALIDKVEDLSEEVESLKTPYVQQG